MKYEGREQELLAHAPVIQDESLRGTSSWGNAFLGRDHTSREKPEGGSPKAEERKNDVGVADQQQQQRGEARNGREPQAAGTGSSPV
jgi:hypothetical protein